MLDNRKPFTFTMLPTAQVRDIGNNKFEVCMNTAKDAGSRSLVVLSNPSEPDTREILAEACDEYLSDNKKYTIENVILEQLALQLDEIAQEYKADLAKMQKTAFRLAQQAIVALGGEEATRQYVVADSIEKLLCSNKKVDVMIWCAPRIGETLRSVCEKICSESAETLNVVVKDNKERLCNKDIEVELPFCQIYYNRKKILEETFRLVVEGLAG